MEDPQFYLIYFEITYYIDFMIHDGEFAALIYPNVPVVHNTSPVGHAPVAGHYRMITCDLQAWWYNNVPDMATLTYTSLFAGKDGQTLIQNCPKSTSLTSD